MLALDGVLVMALEIGDYENGTEKNWFAQFSIDFVGDVVLLRLFGESGSLCEFGRHKFDQAI